MKFPGNVQFRCIFWCKFRQKPLAGWRERETTSLCHKSGRFQHVLMHDMSYLLVLVCFLKVVVAFVAVPIRQKTIKHINSSIYLYIIFAHFVSVLAVRDRSNIVPAPWMGVFVVSHDCYRVS